MLAVQSESTNPRIIIFGAFSPPRNSNTLRGRCHRLHHYYVAHVIRGTQGLEQAFSFHPCFSPSALCEGMGRGETYDTNKTLIRLAGGVCAHYAITLKLHFFGRESPGVLS
jgi:hypothetical protein